MPAWNLVREDGTVPEERPERFVAHAYGNHWPDVSVLFRNRPDASSGRHPANGGQGDESNRTEPPGPAGHPTRVGRKLPGGSGSTAITTICRERMTCGR
ncbi:hypothetical protein SAMN02787144_10375 [Streptomyces atratus]|uniref:Uncharacterized protein n=1 Tax=Streptomyces atratus TaxID=1893 RepID=A0A1K2F8N0_STRAR|nr:hypothetical protein SAMN02787144_10375 [Streptomyces atratus]